MFTGIVQGKVEEQLLRRDEQAVEPKLHENRQGIHRMHVVRREMQHVRHRHAGRRRAGHEHKPEDHRDEDAGRHAHREQKWLRQLQEAVAASAAGGGARLFCARDARLLLL